MRIFIIGSMWFLLTGGYVFTWQNLKDEKFTTVISHGKGLSEQDAIKDALISAIRQSSGTYLHNEIVIKNDVLKKDNLLAISDGMVSDFKLLSVSKDSNGFFLVKAFVTVEKRKTLTNLLFNPTQSNAKDGKKLYGEIVSQMDRVSEGKKFLTVLFNNYPEYFLEAVLVGKAKVNNSNNESKPVISNSINVKINTKKYRDYANLISTVLKKFSSNCGFIAYDAVLRPYSNQSKKDVFFDRTTSFNDSDKNFFEIKSNIYSERWWTKDFNESTHFVLILNKDYDFNGYTTWEWFHLPKVILPSKSLLMHITFLNDSGNELIESNVPMGPVNPGIHISERSIPFSKGNRCATQVIMSPFFLSPPFFKADFLITKDIQMEMEKLRKVEDVKFSFFDRNTKTDGFGEKITSATFQDELNGLSRKNPPTEKTNQPRVNARTAYRTN